MGSKTRVFTDTQLLSPYLGITYYYEAFYEVWLGGQYFKRVAELHKEYGSCPPSHIIHCAEHSIQGPIVRITPNEVHWNDPDFIDGIYPGPASRTNKPLWFAERTGSKYCTVCKKKDAATDLDAPPI